MTLRLPLSGNKHATIVSAYAPTMTNPDEVKDKFYDDLDNVISATPRTDKLILLGDFNARVGTDHQTWEGVIGPEGVGKCNSNGLLLLRKCAEHDLLITNTVFRLPNRNKTSWMHPRSKHWHLIDYVIVRRTDRRDVKVTKTMCGADCWTDHRLFVSKLNLRIQPARRPQGKKAPKRLDVSKLNKDSMRQDFLTDICNQLDAMNLSSEDPEENWTVFHKTVLSSAASTLGHPSRKHQDWFDENDDEIQRLLEEKHRLHKAHQDDTSSVSKKAAYSNICLRKLLKIKWQDKIPDTEGLTKAGMQSMHTVLKLAQLRWTGHVIRMPDARLPKKVFYGELQEGKRSQSGQKKRYKDTLKASLKDFEIPMGSWEQTAQERSKWRGLINKGAALYEKKRICEAERKRRERKAKTNVPPSDSMTLTCSTCNRQFRARIGLVSHQRTHQHTSALFKK